MPRIKGWNRQEVLTRTEKICTNCGIAKSLDEFHKARRSVDGHKGECKLCRKIKAQAAYQKDKAHWRDRYERQRDEVRKLKSQPCSDCGQTFHPSVMQFHHVRGPKLFNIGTGAGKSMNMILAEISKCDLVCANCHIMRHVTQNDLGRLGL